VTVGKSLALYSQTAGFYDLAIGDSVAVDGVCRDGGVAPEVYRCRISETLRRTTLGQLQMDDGFVNLETSLRVGSKLGGHFVMGHVDGIGCLQALQQTATSWEMSFTSPDAIARYIVSKGYCHQWREPNVADYDSALSWFKVSVIPLTC